MCTMRCLTVALCVVLACAGREDTYRVAFVELHPLQGKSPDETLALNANASAQLAAAAAARGAQLLVFPEYGITGLTAGTSREAWTPYLEEVPAPNGEVLCDGNHTATLVTLSCAARQHGIAIVADVAEVYNGKRYNTGVAFDIHGAYVAKARKYNLWGEPWMDFPTSCSDATHAIFNAGFGVEFGLAVCADMNYLYPAVAMAERGVANFIFPISWSNEMAHMQAMPFAQGWSATHCVNTITSNRRASTTSGSGIFSCGRVVNSYYHIAPPVATGPLVLGDLPRVPIRSPTHIPTSIPQSARTGGASGWSFLPVTLSEGGRYTLCSGGSCCHLKVDAVKEDEQSGADGTKYTMIALDGLDDGGDTKWPAIVCGVVACQTADKSCLTYQHPKGPVPVSVALTLQVTPRVDAVYHPCVALSSGSGADQLLLQSLTFSSSPPELVVPAPHPLISAVLYGRPFQEDHLPYHCKSLPTVASL